MASNIVFTAGIGQTTIECDINGTAYSIQAHSSDYSYVRRGDIFRLFPLTGEFDMGEFVNDDLTTPYADADALEVALQGFFSLTSSMTIAELVLAMAASTLPTGQFVIITDLADDGAIFLVTSPSTISVAGQGRFLNADWQDVGNFTGVEAVTTVPFTGNIGVWYPNIEQTEIVYSNLLGGTFTVGATVSDTHGWIGTILTDNGVDTMTAIGFNTITPGDPIDGAITDGTATADEVSSSFPLIQVGDVVIANEYLLDALGNIVPRCSHFQAINVAQFGTSDEPATNTTSFRQLLRSDANQGYIAATQPIEYDVVHDLIQRRIDPEANIDILTTYATIFAHTWQRNPLISYEWGKANRRDIRMNDGILRTTQYIDEMKSIYVAPDAECILMQITRSPDNADILRLSCLENSVSEIIIGDGVTISNVEFGRATSNVFSIAANATFDGRLVVSVLKANLTADLAAGIPLFTGITDAYFMPVFDFLQGAGTPYTLATDLALQADGTTVATIPASFITSGNAGNFTISQFTAPFKWDSVWTLTSVGGTNAGAGGKNMEVVITFVSR